MLKHLRIAAGALLGAKDPAASDQGGARNRFVSASVSSFVDLRPDKPLSAADARRLDSVNYTSVNVDLVKSYPELKGVNGPAIALARDVEAALGSHYLARLRKSGIAAVDVDVMASVRAGYGSDKHVIFDQGNLSRVTRGKPVIATGHFQTSPQR